jgi:GNAT superfamily N-acetyltransferase
MKWVIYDFCRERDHAVRQAPFTDMDTYDRINDPILKAPIRRDMTASVRSGDLVAAVVRWATGGRPTFRWARASDLPAIVKLVNAANSGDGGTAGWTHELDLFHGERTDIAEIRRLFAARGALFLLCIERGEIGGCAHLKANGAAAYMGLLSVRPTLQGRGIGSQLIAESERTVRDEMGYTKLRISVITSHRPELTVFYQRRGFVLTGEAKEFERRQAARIEGLRLEWMEKDLPVRSRLQPLLKGFASWLHRARPTKAAASAGRYSSR